MLGLSAFSAQSTMLEIACYCLQVDKSQEYRHVFGELIWAEGLTVFGRVDSGTLRSITIWWFSRVWKNGILCFYAFFTKSFKYLMAEYVLFALVLAWPSMSYMSVSVFEPSRLTFGWHWWRPNIMFHESLVVVKETRKPTWSLGADDTISLVVSVLVWIASHWSFMTIENAKI